MRKPFFVLAALSLNFCLTANADSLPQDEGLDFLENGEALVNGAPFKAGVKDRPADIYAEVAKVIQGPEGSTVLYLRPIEAVKIGPDGKEEHLKISADARPFVAEQDWKLYDAEGKLTDDPRFAVRVILPYPAEMNAALFEVKWNECEGPITGNYTGYPCNKNRGLSDEYMVFLKDNFLGCVNQGLAKSGLPAAVSAHIQHDGTIADERHSRGSLHAVGRAIDVMQITVKHANSQKVTFDFTKTNTNRRISNRCAPAESTNCRFFEELRACWHKIHAGRKCPARANGPIGTIGWEDKSHIAHHLHTSFPFCPNNKGYFITDAEKH